jgi:hypothetical protein
LLELGLFELPFWKQTTLAATHSLHAVLSTSPSTSFPELYKHGDSATSASYLRQPGILQLLRATTRKYKTLKTARMADEDYGDDDAFYYDDDDYLYVEDDYAIAVSPPAPSFKPPVWPSCLPKTGSQVPGACMWSHASRFRMSLRALGPAVVRTHERFPFSWDCAVFTAEILTCLFFFFFL